MNLDRVASTQRTQPRATQAGANLRPMQTLRRGVMALIMVSTAFHAGCAVKTPAGPQETSPDPASTVRHTLPHMDPAHPPHVGQRYYPTESMALGEEGICRMAVTVEPDGRVSERHLVRSSGLPRLDAACIGAFPADVRFIPATRDGKPVRDSVVIPIVWCFGQNCRDRAEKLSLQRL